MWHNIPYNNALYSVKSRRNLLSFKDIRLNGYHIETTYDNNKEYLCITHIVSSQKLVVEKLHAFSSGLYYTTLQEKMQFLTYIILTYDNICQYCVFKLSIMTYITYFKAIMTFVHDLG